MKLSNSHVTAFLREIVSRRINTIGQQREKLDELLNQLNKQELTNEEAADLWMDILKDRYAEILSVKDIMDELSIKRTGINKAFYNIRSDQELQREVNQLIGVSLSGMNIVLDDAYELWKQVRKDEKGGYPSGGDFERQQILASLPKEERQYLK